MNVWFTDLISLFYLFQYLKCTNHFQLIYEINENHLNVKSLESGEIREKKSHVFDECGELKFACWPNRAVKMSWRISLCEIVRQIQKRFTQRSVHRSKQIHISPYESDKKKEYIKISNVSSCRLF